MTVTRSAPAGDVVRRAVNGPARVRRRRITGRHWDLRVYPPQAAKTVSHPNVHLVFEETGAMVSGVNTSKFTKVLEGKSGVEGVKFRPGGFRPFLGAAVSKLARRLFGDAVLIKPSPKKVEAFLRDRLPAPDEWPCCLARCELGKRSPQRLCGICGGESEVGDPAVQVARSNRKARPCGTGG